MSKADKGQTCAYARMAVQILFQPPALRKKGSTKPASPGRDPDEAHNQKAINHEIKPSARKKSQ